MSPEFVALLKWVIEVLALGVVTYGVREITKMRESVQELNVTVAKMLVRQDAQDQRAIRHDNAIERIDERVRHLEITGGN